MSDGDSENKTIKRKKQTISPIQRVITNVGNVLSAFRLRCSIQNDNGFKWLVLDCRRRFLFNFRLFLVIVYIAYSLSK